MTAVSSQSAASIPEYRHQAVRDLAWSCFSPALLEALPDSDVVLLQVAITEEEQAWLARLDRDPAPLLQALEQLGSTRLGLYFEALWAFYWQQHPRWKLLAHNLQVNHEGKTLGAFDFLCRGPGGEYWHIEHAVKFYLGVGGNPEHSEPSDWRQWLGPNSNDRLDIKLRHLLNHQLRLSQSPEGSALLHKRYAGIRWRRALCLHGYLFYPGHQQLPAPVAANARHLSGHWWYLRDFAEHSRGEEYLWLILERQHWLSPARSDQRAELLDTGELLHALEARVSPSGSALLVARMLAGEGHWRECSRHFVVPDHWPGTATPSRNT